MNPAKTPEPPYYAVIFSSTQTGEDLDGYGRAAAEMEALASRQDGYLGFESARDANGLGVSVSYWRDEAAVKAWKRASEHAAAQAKGRARWYQAYEVRVARVERAYGFERTD